jgi:hypothetical protein
MICCLDEKMHENILQGQKGEKIKLHKTARTAANVLPFLMCAWRRTFPTGESPESAR